MKRVANRAYVHVSAVGELPQGLRRRVDVAAARVPRGWSLARIDLKSPAVMLGWTESWETEAHPRLLVSRLVVPGKNVTVTDYRKRASKPIYHRKESMVRRAHPQFAQFAALSKAEEVAGLLGRSDIGTDKAWARVLAAAGYTVKGHKLVKVRGRGARGRGAKRTKRNPAALQRYMANRGIPVKLARDVAGVVGSARARDAEWIARRILQQVRATPASGQRDVVEAMLRLAPGMATWMRRARPNYSGLAFDEAVTAAEDWFKVPIPVRSRDVVYDFGDGWAWVRVPLDEFALEGKAMRCSLSRKYRRFDVYSLRDARNRPHVSVTIFPSKTGAELKEVKGKANARPPAPQYSQRTVEWLATKPFGELRLFRHGEKRALGDLEAVVAASPNRVAVSDLIVVPNKGRGNRATVEQRILGLLPAELTHKSGMRDWAAHDPRVVITEVKPSLYEPGTVEIEIRAESLPFAPNPRGAELGRFAARLLPKGKEQMLLERARWRFSPHNRGVRGGCTREWSRARAAGVTRLAHVTGARLELNLQNRGIGRAGYDALLAWAAENGAALIPARCIGLDTSPEAERTWRALLRDYPSSGSMAWLPEAVRGRGNTRRVRALVIVHPSSLDSYASQVGTQLGSGLGERLVDAAVTHDGPVVVLYSRGLDGSRGRRFLRGLRVRPDAKIIEHCDSESGAWCPSEGSRLDGVSQFLRGAGVGSVAVVGLWYEPNESPPTGCVIAAAEYLRSAGFDVQIDVDLTGSMDDAEGFRSAGAVTPF